MLGIWMIRENPITGARTWGASPELWDAVCRWHELHGRNPWEHARNARVNSNGVVTFRTGVGYNLLSDLVGQDVHAFEIWAGEGVSRARNKRDYNRQCREWAKYHGA